MKKFSLVFSFLVLTSVSFVSCTKDDVQQPAIVTGAIVKKWALTDVLSVSGSTSVSMYASMFEDCVKDDIWDFQNGGILVLSEGATKCDPGDPASTKGSWQLLENNTKIKIDDSQDTVTYKVDALTDKSMRLSINFSEYLKSLGLTLSEYLTMTGVPANAIPANAGFVFVYTAK
jgi:hypothetical protein